MNMSIDESSKNYSQIKKNKSNASLFINVPTSIDEINESNDNNKEIILFTMNEDNTWNCPYCNFRNDEENDFYCEKCKINKPREHQTVKKEIKVPMVNGVKHYL
jgi:hypothetical protein